VPPTDTPGAGSPPDAPVKVDRTKSVIAPAGRAVSTARPGPRAAGRVPAQGGNQVMTKGASKSFVNDTIAELRRVVWPNTETVRSGTIVTIGLLIFFGLYISGLDIAAQWLFKTLGLYPNLK